MIPPDALLVLATTTGEIDILEQRVLTGNGDAVESKPSSLLEKIKTLSGVRGDGLVISSACTSSSAAIGFAASLINSGRRDCVLIVACDAVTEFVFSGFSSLMALDPDKAKPFDKNRAGLSLGEGAGFIFAYEPGAGRTGRQDDLRRNSRLGSNRRRQSYDRSFA